MVRRCLKLFWWQISVIPLLWRWTGITDLFITMKSSEIGKERRGPNWPITNSVACGSRPVGSLDGLGSYHSVSWLRSGRTLSASWLRSRRMHKHFRANFLFIAKFYIFVILQYELNKMMEISELLFHLSNGIFISLHLYFIRTCL